MKILFVSQYFYPEDFKINDIAFDFVKRGHQVTVFTGKPNYPQGKFYKGYGFFGNSKENINGVEVIRIPLFPRLNSSGKYLVLNYLSFVFFSFIFKYKIKKQYDIVFSHLPSPLIAALPAIWFQKKCQAKLYLWVLDLWPESVLANTTIKEGFLLKNLNKIIKKIYKAADFILISSKFFEKSILEKGEDLHHKIKYFPNWAEDVFLKESDLQTPDMPMGFNIMFAGNIGDSQDFEAILEAAKLSKNDQINWVLVGDGRKVNWIKTAIEKHQLKNVFLMGRHPIEAMPSFFKKADVMLVSLKKSPVFALTIPAKVQAYMASSKIILGMFDGEGQQLINESQCGFAVDAGCFNLLYQKALHLKSLSQSQRQEMEQNSKNYYDQNFSKTQLFDFLENDFKNQLKCQ